MRHCFQLIDKNSGQRSKPFVMTSKALADELFAKEPELDFFYVLCVGDIDDNGELKLSEAPLLLARSFVSTFHVTVSENRDG